MLVKSKKRTSLSRNALSQTLDFMSLTTLTILLYTEAFVNTFFKFFYFFLLSNTIHYFAKIQFRLNASIGLSFAAFFAG